MVEEWQLVRLGDVATTSQGGTPRKNEADYWNGQIPFLTGADLTEFRLSRKHARSFLTTEGLHSGQTVVCEPGVLLLATRTRVGLAGLTTETMGASQDITRLTPSDEVHSGYLCRYLLSVAASLQRKSRGTTIQGITKDELQSIAIPLPPLPEQRAIAAILDSIDQAIEATDALISATEQLRDSLLHNLLTRGLPGRHTEWKQVPGLGTIPADWQTARLGDVADVERGKFAHRPRNEPRFYGGGIPFIQTGDVVRANGKIRQHFQTLNELGLSISRLFPAGTIIVTIAANIGETAIATYPIAFPDSLVGITPMRIDSSFLEYFLRTQKLRLNQLAPESAQKNINLEVLRPLLVPLPPLPYQQTIAAVLDSIEESIDEGREAGEGLRKLKESASDALLTGRVRVAVRDNAD